MDYILDVAIFLLIGLKIVYPRLKTLNRNKKIIGSLFFIYLFSVYALTLMPFRPIGNYFSSGFQFSFHFNPFSDVINSYGPAYREAFLNVLMLLPFGFLIPLFHKRNLNIIDIILSSFSLSFIIEFLQLFDPARSSDVTDLINNTLGGVLGYTILKLYLSYRKQREGIER